MKEMPANLRQSRFFNLESAWRQCSRAPLTRLPARHAPGAQALLHAVLGRHLAALEAAAGPRAVALLSEMRQFLDHNPEMRKLLSRQMLVDLHTYSVERETSLQGLFGVRGGSG